MMPYRVEQDLRGWKVVIGAGEDVRQVASIGHGAQALNAADDCCRELNELCTRVQLAGE